MMILNRVRNASLLAALAGTTLLMVTGCDQRSDSTKAVQAASDSLHRLGVTGTPGAEDKLRAVAAGVQDVSSNGTDSEKATASLLVAQTLRHQGAVTALAAKNFELTLSNQSTLVRAAVSDWSNRSAVALAAEAFDPAKQISELEATKKVKEAELQEQSAKLDAATKQLAALEAQAKSKLDAATVEADAYTVKSQSILTMNATQAAKTVEEAREYRRRADNLRTEAGKITAQAEMLKPVVNELTLLRGATANQIKNLDESVASLRRRQEASRLEASEARKAASVAANDADKIINEILELHGKDLEAAYKTSIDTFEKAASRANAGSASAASAAKVMSGSAHLSLAEAHWAKATGTKSVVTMLTSLTRVAPPLPANSEYAKKADELNQQAKASLEAATTALESAKNAFSTARSTDADVKDRLARLSESIEKAKGLTSGAAMDQPAPAEAEVAPADAAKPEEGAAPADGSATATPTDPALLAVVDQVVNLMRQGKMNDTIALSTANTPELLPVIKPLYELTENILAASAATKQKYNLTLDGVFKLSPGLSQMAGPLTMLANPQMTKDIERFNTLTSADFQYNVTGDRADATAEGLSTPLMFVKKDGVWLMDMSQFALMAPMLKQQIKFIESMSPVIKDWTTEISADTYADGSAAAAGLQAKLGPVMAEMMKPRGGG